MGKYVPFSIIGSSVLLVGAIVVTLVIGRSSALAFGNNAPAQAPQSQQAYCEVYEHALASALKVDMAHLAAANKSALEATIQRAQSDGALTQTQATKLLNSVKQMGADPCADLARFQTAQHAQMASARQAIEIATASALKLTPATLESDLASGMTIPEIASAQHVSLSDVNAAYLNAVQTQLNTAVTNGALSQAQATKLYTSIQRAVAAGKYPLLGTHESKHK